MTKDDAVRYLSFAVDDALSERRTDERPDNARLIGWQCGFEPLFVAVWSYLPGVTLSDDDAEELARDLLQEKRWFADCDNPPPADYII
jgi:hypothetical protein